MIRSIIFYWGTTVPITRHPIRERKRCYIQQLRLKYSTVTRAIKQLCIWIQILWITIIRQLACRWQHGPTKDRMGSIPRNNTPHVWDDTIDNTISNGERMALDKDLLCPGNKEYGPDQCILLSRTLNIMLSN